MWYFGFAIKCVCVCAHVYTHTLISICVSRKEILCKVGAL